MNDFDSLLILLIAFICTLLFLFSYHKFILPIQDLQFMKAQNDLITRPYQLPDTTPKPTSGWGDI